MADATAKPPTTAPATAARQGKAPGAKKAASAAKPVTKAVAKPVAIAATKPTVVVSKQRVAKPSKPMAAPKPTKMKKPKMVRDSMTIPKAEYAVLDVLKLRATQLASPVKKTELLRAGIKALAAMSDANFELALKAVPSLKTGRPSKS